MERLNKLTPVFVEHIPENMEHGKLYISKPFAVAGHLCACGCGKQTYTSLQPHYKTGWSLTEKGDKITLRPSIGNFSGQRPYHAHYYITDNKIQ